MIGASWMTPQNIYHLEIIPDARRRMEGHLVLTQQNTYLTHRSPTAKEVQLLDDFCEKLEAALSTVSVNESGYPLHFAAAFQACKNQQP